MKCPNCGETLKDTARVCFMCGEHLPEHEVDKLLDSMIEETKTTKKSKVNKETDIKKDSKPKKESRAKNDAKQKNDVKVYKPSKSSSKQKSSAGKAKPSTAGKTINKSKSDDGFFKSLLGIFNKKKKEEAVQEEEKPQELGLAARITAYLTCIVIFIFIISLNFTWFGFQGSGAFEGVKNTDAGAYFHEEIRVMTETQVEELPETTELFIFKGKDLEPYMSGHEEHFKMYVGSDGEIKESIPAKIQFYYLLAMKWVVFIAVFAIGLLLIDRKLKATEWSRAAAVLSFLIIGANYIALKIPFFSMIAIKTQSVLRTQDALTAVSMNLDGIHVDKTFYAYNLVEKSGFFTALICCGIWFLLSTVLIEMKRDKEI